EPEDFVGDFLRRRLAVSAVLLGSHFAFGRGKRGNLELLRGMGPANGFTADGIGEVFHDWQPISSTRIRQAIEGRGIRSANAMLGRPHAMDGVIARGDRMGRKIGYPTINLQPENELSPGDGVYFSRVYFKSFGREFDCVTNIGRRPTVYENYETTIESFVLDFSSDVYGEKIRLFFHDRVRDEMTFPSMMALTEQIGRDIEATRAYFSRPWADPSGDCRNGGGRGDRRRGRRRRHGVERGALAPARRRGTGAGGGPRRALVPRPPGARLGRKIPPGLALGPARAPGV